MDGLNYIQSYAFFDKKQNSHADFIPYWLKRLYLYFVVRKSHYNALSLWTNHNIIQITSFMDSNKQTSKDFELEFQTDLHDYLEGMGKIDSRPAESPDLDGLWPKVGEAYLPDALREFSDYPTVTLGWMMYIGMALAKYWDEDWNVYGQIPDLYGYMLEHTDYDHLDEYICSQVLMLSAEEHDKIEKIVAECASRTYNRFCHLGLEPGTESAFRAFVGALHQMYKMGIAMQFKAMGYHMERLQ